MSRVTVIAYLVVLAAYQLSWPSGSTALYVAKLVSFGFCCWALGWAGRKAYDRQGRK